LQETEQVEFHFRHADGCAQYHAQVSPFFDFFFVFESSLFFDIGQADGSVIAHARLPFLF
jgi:hypothetical protein